MCCAIVSLLLSVTKCVLEELVEHTVIPVVRRPWQEDYDFQANLDYIASHISWLPPLKPTDLQGWLEIGS